MGLVSLNSERNNPIGAGSFPAIVSSTTGSPSTGTFSTGGRTYQYYRWTGSGSVTFSKGGQIDLLVVGGGGSGRGSFGGGGGGAVRFGIFDVDASTYTVTVGGGGGVSQFGSIIKSGAGSSGSGTHSWPQDFGFGQSSGGGSGGAYGQNENGTYYVIGSGQGSSFWGSSNHGITLNYANANVDYGARSGAAAHTGQANTSGSGGSGVVIIRIEQ